jgi:hypothetical protein
MEGIVEELDRNFSKVLKALLDEAAPGNAVDEKTLLRIFRTKLERGFERWGYVPDRCVEAGD